MKKKVTLYIALVLLLGACYPEGPEYYEDIDIVYTNYEETYDFSTKGTYAIPDKIVRVTGELLEGAEPKFLEEPYNSQIIQRIESNMAELGWTKVADPADADLAVFPAVWSNTTIYYWYDYWCWYYPWYCGYGWGYPSFSVSYTAGTMVMTMVANEGDYIEPNRVWTAAANGLLSGAVDISRVNVAIDQAFDQSPYLNVN